MTFSKLSTKKKKTVYIYNTMKYNKLSDELK